MPMPIVYGHLLDSCECVLLALQSVRVTAYISDDTGYHEVPLPPTGPDAGTGIVDYGPIDSGSKCDLAKGEYCIDQKLLNLMVG